MDASYAVSEVLKYLRQTPEFSALRQARSVLSKNPQANTLVSQFQKKQESLYSGGLSQNQQKYLIDELNESYKNLAANPDIRNYFEASEKFSALLNGFIGQLNSELAKELR